MDFVVDPLKRIMMEEKDLVLCYPYRKGYFNDLVVFYYFVTDDADRYSVRFVNTGKMHNRRKQVWQVDFATDHAEGYTGVVNKGRVFRVISTVVSVIREFIRENSKCVDGLDICPVYNFRNDHRRYNIYMRYIDRFMPEGWKKKRKLFESYICLRKI